jgi:hypothetical protein
MANLDDVARAVKLNQEACKKDDKEKLKLLEIAREHDDDLEKEGLHLSVFPWGTASTIYVFSGNRPRSRCFFDRGKLEPISPAIYNSEEGYTRIYQCSEHPEHKYRLPPRVQDIKKLRENQSEIFADDS